MSVANATPTRTKGGWVKTAGLWALAVLLACLFILSGSMKFISPEMAKQFAEWGYPDWFRVLIGVVEVGGALLLLVPRTAFYGAAALGVVMVGAVYTHLVHGEFAHAAVPFVLLLLLALVGHLRRPHFAK